MTRPAVTVVVPSHNRPDGVEALLRSLERQKFGASDFEVVVVDDGSRTPLDRDALARVAPDLNLSVVRHEAPRGPAAARNSGWRAGRGRLVAFVDDDCVATPGWLPALAEVAGERDDVIVQGRTEPDPEGRERIGPFSVTLRIAGPNRLFQTCNLAYARALLEHVGGFDESFRHACGEDVDLGLRAERAGGRLEYAGDALVYHAIHEPGVWRTVRRMHIWTDAVRIQKMYPETRRFLTHGVFWKPSHPPLVLALLGLLLALGGRRAGLALALPYVAHHRGRHLPAHAAIDTAELATMLAGSVKHRHLML